MYKTVRDYLAEEEAEWNSIPANVTAQAALVTKIDAIDTLVTRQEAELKGFTVQKADARAELERTTLLVADATAAYARTTNNEVLVAEMDLTPTDLSRASDQRITDVAARVATAANDVLVALVDYGVTAGDMTALNTAMTDFETAKTLPDVKRAQRAGMTEELETLFGETAGFLKEQLDRLMARYRSTSPEFHAGYEAARVIIDLHGPGDPDAPPPPPPGP